MSALPDKPSELLELAVNDALELEKTPGFEVDMTHWVSRDDKGPCRVCLAGAVMVQHLGAKHELAQHALGSFYREPADYDDDDGLTWRQLDALDFFRQGEVKEALEILEVESWKVPDCSVPPYFKDREGFFAALRQLVTDLREAGL